MLGLKKKSIVISTGKFYTSLCIVIIMFTALFSSLSPVYGDSYRVPQDGLKTYVVYDSVHREGDQFPFGNLLIEYLGHFDLSINKMPISEWTPGSMADADLIVYIGLDQYDLPKKLLAEMAHAKQIIWFENNIEQMANHLGWGDFRLGMTARGWHNVSLDYKQDKHAYPFNDQQHIVLTSPGQKAEVLATVSNPNITKPLAWKRGNISYCGLVNFEEKFIHIMTGLLHQFISNDHSHSRSAFLRIEDVNPQTSARSLRAIVSVIKRHNIPFAIGVVPLNVAADGTVISLRNRADLVRVLKDAQNNGGSIIQHGYTHQNIFSPTTGEGYEFWNARDNKPMEDDRNFTKERVQAGMTELVRNGLTPLAFEPPHYAMSKTGYEVLSEHYNIFSGQLQLSDDSATITGTLPYIAKSTYLNGMLVIPENLGYVDGKEFSLKGLLAHASSIARVQDGIAGLFYHGYLPAETLDTIIPALKKNGYKFLDLRKFPIKIKSDQITITGDDGNITVEVDDQLKASWRKDSMQPYMTGFMSFVVVFVLFRIRYAKKIGKTDKK